MADDIEKYSSILLILLVQYEVLTFPITSLYRKKLFPSAQIILLVKK